MNEIMIAGGSVSLITMVITELVFKRGVGLAARWIPSVTVVIAVVLSMLAYLSQASGSYSGLLESFAMGVYSAAIATGIYSSVKATTGR